MDKKKKKQICVNLPIEVYEKFKKNADKRRLDNTNYVMYLVENDREDMYSKGAAKRLNSITRSTEELLRNVKKDDNIRPFVVDIRDGVKELWRYLR